MKRAKELSATTPAQSPALPQSPEQAGGMADQICRRFAKTGMAGGAEKAEIYARSAGREVERRSKSQISGPRPSHGRKPVSCRRPWHRRRQFAQRLDQRVDILQGMCAALSEMRSRLDPCGTVGGRMAGPESRADPVRRRARARRPRRRSCTGTIWLALAPQFHPCAAQRLRANARPGPSSVGAARRHLRNQRQGGVDGAEHGGRQAGAVDQTAAALDQEIADVRRRRRDRSRSRRAPCQKCPSPHRPDRKNLRRGQSLARRKRRWRGPRRHRAGRETPAPARRCGRDRRGRRPCRTRFR